MSTVEIALWAIAVVTVLAMINRTWDIAVSGIQFWLRRSVSLLLRLPIFLLAIACIVGGIELVYDINARAWFAETDSGSEFRWWLLILTPLVLSVASLGFSVPYLAYFFLVPHLQRNPQFHAAARTLLSALVIITVPMVVYAIQYVL